MQKLKNKTGWITGTSIVVANMIGAGVFTSLGMQLNVLSDPKSILILWALGGLMALCGAFSYAELGTYFRRSGGEYHFLSRIYHPILGYLSGWVSITVGFTAPIALAAISMGAYLEDLLFLDAKITATLVILISSLVHSFTINNSSFFQNLITLFKVLALLVFIIVGIRMGDLNTGMDFSSNQWIDDISKPSFAVAFVFVCFSYSGWNAAAYITGEIRNVSKNLPRALIFGTLIVTLIYLLLHYVFMINADIESLRGKLDIGTVVASKLWGEEGALTMSTIIAILLLSSISAMVWVGSRVTQVIGEDYLIWRKYSKVNASGVPVRAIWLQAAISIAFVFTGSFEQVLIYSGFIIQLFSALAVGGLLLIPRKKKRPGSYYRSPLYPVPQWIFILMSFWVLVYLLYDKPAESLYGVLSLLIAALSYFYNKKLGID